MNKTKLTIVLGLAVLTLSPALIHAADDNTQIIAALGELKGSLNTQVESLKSEIAKVSDFAKATYGRLLEMSKRMDEQDALQKNALKAMTGTADPNVIVKQIEGFRKQAGITRAEDTRPAITPGA